MTSEHHALLVQPDTEYASRFEEKLARVGLVIRCAFNSKQGRTMALASPPAALIFDLDQPAREAVRLLCDLRAQGVNPPVLWLTSTVNEAAISRVTSAGAQGLLSKSTNTATMLSAVRSVMAGDTFFLDQQPPASSSGVRVLNESERLLRLLQG